MTTLYGETKPSNHEHTMNEKEWCVNVFGLIKELQYVCTRLKGHDGKHEAATIKDGKAMVVCEWEE